ncbi:DUF4279 domain-containing protein [Henriciella litoralis]|uniref:DUF4279 domain-containing protein n=1 Tax=Henriciella litoralis TaxID=568102 RepID=UPI0009FD306D|nr:DUF4279 domain-containing protein [Henriciella litoralis]
MAVNKNDSNDYETSSFFSVTAQDLDPNNVTRLLGIQPRKSSNTLEQRKKSINPAHRFWHFSTPESAALKHRSVEDAILALFEKGALNVDLVAQLPATWDKEIIITAFTDERPCFALSPATAALLGKAGILIVISVYAGPESED